MYLALGECVCTLYRIVVLLPGLYCFHRCIASIVVLFPPLNGFRRNPTSPHSAFTMSVRVPCGSGTRLEPRR